MDEVLEKFEGTLISREPNDNSKTSFEGLYKNWGKLGNQEERRKELLDVQKSNRNSKLDKFRGIIELINAVEDNDNIFKYQNHKPYYRPSIYVAGFTKTSLSYNNVLMMSEWMIEKPEDFYENWYVTPCPRGVRMLVVANQGRTKCYTKYGQFRHECRTALPGGNPCDSGFRNHCCVLDCFYVEASNTMYVIDLLAWNSQPMTDGETEFRNFWLQSHLGDIAELKTINKKNKLIFNILPMTPCTPESFNKFMMTFPHFENFTPILDGLLFYHKKAHYVAGETPLVGWLFPYMVPEVLGTEITVNPAYMAEKPINYVNQAEFINKFEEKVAKKNPVLRRSRNNSAMDTTPVKPDNKSDSNKKNTRKPKTRTKSAQYEEMEADEKLNQEKANSMGDSSKNDDAKDDGMDDSTKDDDTKGDGNKGDATQVTQTIENKEVDIKDTETAEKKEIDEDLEKMEN